MGLKRLVTRCADLHNPLGGRYVIRRRSVQLLAVAVAMSCLAGHASASEGAATYAPVNQAGPTLSVPQRTLDRAIACDQDPATAHRDVILAIQTLALDSEEAYGWNYFPAFRSKGWPYCTVTVPEHATGDIQVAAEYIVNAIRRIHATSGHKVALFGWSEGASTTPRWALRWWPDIRHMVSALAGVAPVNEGGSDTAEVACAAECVPAAWQLVRRLDQSPPHFITAMNSGRQTFPEIAYTVVYTKLDEIAGLNVITTPVAPLPLAPNVVNVSLQDICPTQIFEHATIIASSVGYAVIMGALAHPGELPDLTSINRRTVCSNPLMPTVTPVSLATNELKLVALVAVRLTQHMIPREPPLKCYVYTNRTCPGVDEPIPAIPSLWRRH